MTKRTELVWHYTPADFFDDTKFETADGTLVASKGCFTLERNGVEVEQDVIDRAGAVAKAVVGARMLAVNRHCTVTSSPTIYRHDGQGHTSVAVTVSDVARLTVSASAPGVVVTDSDGRVLRDLRAEALQREQSFVADLAPKIARSPLLQNLVEMYARALRDPANEFVHLYEIRDQLAQHFGSDAAAKKALNLSDTQWKELGKLANSTPVDVGRHRGEHAANLRRPTEDEIDRARAAAVTLIKAAAAVS